MVFSSLSFLLLFLPVAVLGYVLIPNRFANAWLLAMSLWFYWTGDSKHIGLLLATIGIAWLAGILLENCRSNRIRGIILMVGVAALLILMSYFKYWAFILENINAIFHRNLLVPEIAFPIGISFFIFQAISYMADVFRGEKIIKNPIDMALYIAFFPQLIAGPIVRYHDIAKYLDVQYRKPRLQNFADGMYRFCIGLSKKVLIANQIGGGGRHCLFSPEHF